MFLIADLCSNAYRKTLVRDVEMMDKATNILIIIGEKCLSITYQCGEESRLGSTRTMPFKSFMGTSENQKEPDLDMVLIIINGVIFATTVDQRGFWNEQQRVTKLQDRSRF